MSSDTYSLEIVGIRDVVIDLHCTTEPGGAVNSMDFTRSFVLMALDAALESPWEGKPCVRDPSKHPLRIALEKLGWQDKMTEADFHEAHVGDFIADVRVTYRNSVANEDEWQPERELLGYCLQLPEGDDALLDRLRPKHSYGLRATVTDAKWLKQLKVGYRYGTTAYDVWADDPQAERNRALLEEPCKPLVQSVVFVSAEE